MASISTDAKGRKRVLFFHPDGTRPAIHLGKVSQRSAENIRYRVEQLAECIGLKRPMDADLTGWVKALKPWLVKKMAKAKLIELPDDGQSNKADLTLGEHLSNYLDRRSDVKASTLTYWRNVKRSLLDFFKPERKLRTVTAADAKDWERWMRQGPGRVNRYVEKQADEGLAVNTIRKRVQVAKQFFADAVESELIDRNPFAQMKGAVRANRERDFFVTRDVIQRVLDACPNAEWRLLVALARYGGLRVPSEPLALRWADINWADERMVVQSVKTARHEGKAQRVVPIFPELRPYLDEAHQMADDGAEYVISRYRDGSVNLRTGLARILAKAGVAQWPKLWQNLRMSRATELATKHPAHVAAEWLGHSIQVAGEHYWRVTEADFANALDGKGPGEETTRKTTQYTSVLSGNKPQEGMPRNEETPELPGFAASCDYLPLRPVGATGLEPVTPSLSSLGLFYSQSGEAAQLWLASQGAGEKRRRGHAEAVGDRCKRAQIDRFTPASLDIANVARCLANASS